MNKKLYTFRFVFLQYGCASALLIGTLFSSTLSQLAAANPTNSLSATAGTLLTQSDLPSLVFNQSNTPVTFERRGRPNHRTSGGSRGDCNDQLIALLPGTDTVTTSATDPTAACNLASMAEQTVTLEESPTLWFYIPAQDRAGIQAELVLVDDNAQALSIQTIELPAESGILGIQFDQPLAVGKPYQWVFSLLQHPNAPSQNSRVEGSLQRVSPDSTLTAALNAAQSPQARAQVLAQQGIWHDALDAIAQLRIADPNDTAAQQSWVSLLSSVGLDAIAQENVLNSDGI